jgi:hypothetical protein
MSGAADLAACVRPAADGIREIPADAKPGVRAPARVRDVGHNTAGLERDVLDRQDLARSVVSLTPIANVKGR